MSGRSAGVAAGLVALLGLTLGAVATADVPAGPRIAFVLFAIGRGSDRDAELRVEVVSADPAGADRRVLAGGSEDEPPLVLPAGPPAWSTDGTWLAFTALRHGAGSELRTQLFAVAADGAGLRRLPGTRGATMPVVSPDGMTIAFARQRERRKTNAQGGEDTVFKSTSVWLANLAGGAPRQITPWRNGLEHSPSGFSPDGSLLAVTRQVAGQPPTALAMRLDGSSAGFLAGNAGLPVYSPDGSKVAFVRGPRREVRGPEGAVRGTFTDLYVKRTGGGGLTRLTNTPDAVELWPSWDPSGQRLVYTETRPLGGKASFLGFGSKLISVNADGSCSSTVAFSPRAAIYGAAWQPGPGREAGPIAC